MKIHRSYTVEEAARLFGVHKNTVRAWIGRGLYVFNEMRPHLIPGRELAAFLQSQRAAKKRPCGLGELYCLRCRAPRQPAGGMVDFVWKTEAVGNLVGICSQCSTMMYRRANAAQLEMMRNKFEITIAEA